MVSIGYGTIDIGTIRRSHHAFEGSAEDRIFSYSYNGVVRAEQWQTVLRELRDWLRSTMEQPKFEEFHLFFRGPIAFGSLIGAIAAGRKPLVVYHFDEDEGLY